MMNPEIIIILIYEIFAPFTPYIATFFIGFCLLAATTALVVKALSFNS